jgi:Na+/H+ antiporter NhaD/arsenite permease-like protein
MFSDERLFYFTRTIHKRHKQTDSELVPERRFFMFELKWLVLALAVLMYLGVIIFQDKKVWFTSIAALIVIVLGVVLPDLIFPLPATAAAAEGAADVLSAGSAYTSFSAHIYALVHSFTALVNWNVLMIYVGSMTIAALFLYSKVPAKIADAIVDASPNVGVAIVAILAMTGFISIFVENVATVLVMAPIALSLSRKLKMNPTFFMMGLAVMSNLEGTATLVGDPPSMIFASYAGYTFNDFFVSNGRLSVFFIVQAGMLSGCIFFYAYFARHGQKKVEVEREQVITWYPAVLLVTMIAGLAGLSFLPKSVTDVFPFASGLFVVTLGAIGVILYVTTQHKSKTEAKKLIKELDWETIAFLIGIFIVVGAIAETGLLDDFAHALARFVNGSVPLGFIVILAVSVLISGFVDNVPYIIVMLPVAGTLAGTMGIRPELYDFALLVGSCLGGNLTPFGASANIVAMGILKKEGYPVKFSGWLKVGVPFTLITTTCAAVALWLLWS